MNEPLQSIIGKTTEEITKIVLGLDEAAFRGKQIADWIYNKSAESFDEMKNLPSSLRSKLQESYCVGLPEVAHRDVSSDGTMKYLMRYSDGVTVESVLLPYKERVSVCLSTQVGCAAGCTFCATAQGGFSRNLTAGEIVGQLLRMQKETERRISHVVYMGMGEPLFNYDATVNSLKLLGSEVGISLRNLTVSTVGVAPAIKKLADEDLPITLALSLHAPDDALRAELIPTAKKWRLEEILEACSYYASHTRRNLTFEYLLIGGVNDSLLQALALAELLKKSKLPGNVNLIPFNYVDTKRGFRKPVKSQVEAFKETLQKAGRITTQRMIRGHEISAACGQLRQRIEKVEVIPLEILTESTV